MPLSTSQFKTHAQQALTDKTLQQALDKLNQGFVKKRAQAVKQCDSFDALRDDCVAMKDHTLDHLDQYLQQFEEQVIANRGHVHHAADAAQACAIATALCERYQAKKIIKSKSMLTEEISLNEALEKNGYEVVETDLGEYIIQLRNESPSHIVVPAMHLLKEQVADTFSKAHSQRDPQRDLSTPEALLREARAELRTKFLSADIGITGANALIAESGTVAIVSNEGNADLTQTLPKTHIVFAGIEKIVPTFKDASNILRLLARSATGQEITSYVTFSTGAKHPDDADGPENFHIILVDNGRRAMLGSDFQDMLRCIRCGACLNHCPVYHSVGGHTYGSMYSGPMGAVMTPSIFGIENATELPHASTFCGRCEAVCPMRIPLPDMMRKYREQAHEQHLTSAVSRWGIAGWAFLAKRPRLYTMLTSFSLRCLAFFTRRKTMLKHLPLLKGWTQHRDFPTPAARTFQAQWRRRKRDH
ncbi:MAG: iron-sulfur cluster-binding protein [Coxiella sp. (in: Bacteria)]|nr:MAG: iron-sulfur cluster-binding protein [Coxiella sp. (in: g-proteobacteria)]